MTAGAFLLQSLGCGPASPGSGSAGERETLGVVAATVSMSRRRPACEFKAIYVAPSYRKQVSGLLLARTLLHAASVL